MKADQQEIIFNGGPFQSYWWADEHEPVHPAIRAKLDHGVDPGILAEAWEQTKKVYPLIDLVPDDEDEEIVFRCGSGSGRPVRSRIPLKPAGEAALYRGFTLTWFEDTVTLACYHSLADEYGLAEIFRTLLAAYFSLRSGTAPQPGVMMKEGRRPEEYFVQNTMLPAEGYTPQPVMLYRDIREILLDADIANEEGSAGTTGEVTVSFAAWEALAGKLNTGSEALLLSIMAGLVCGMYPGTGKKLCLGVMTDFRGTFRIPDTIAPCSKKMPVILNREDVDGHSPETVAALIGRIRSEQLTADYIRSHVAMENTYSVLNIRNACFSLQFSGRFDLGEYTRHILDITMRDFSIRTAFMIRLGNELKISFQYGAATGKYMAAFVAALDRLGVQAAVTAEPVPVHAEAEQPVV